MFGDLEVIDFDGIIMVEKDIVCYWGVLFILIFIFYFELVDEGQGGLQVVVVMMLGVFGCWMIQNLMIWVLEEGYLGEESF